MKTKVQSHNILLKEVQKRLLTDPGFDLFIRIPKRNSSKFKI
jgi:hypothetical protein